MDVLGPGPPLTAGAPAGVEARSSWQASAAWIVAAGLLGAVLLARPPTLLGPAPMLAVLAAINLQGLFPRGRVRRISFTGGAVLLETNQDEARSIPLATGSAIGYSGAVRGGRLSVPLRPGDMVAFKIGRLVILDADGQVVTARPAHGIELAELEALTRRAGYRWAGATSLGRLCLAPAPADPAEAPAPGTRPIDDPATVATLAASRRRALRVTIGWAGSAAVGLGLTARFRPPADAGWFVVAPGIIAIVTIGVVLVAGQSALQSGHRRSIRSILEHTRWEPFEVVTLRGAPANPQVVVVGILDASGTRMTGTWLSHQIDWPPEIERRWYLLAFAADGKRAVLASPDRSRLVPLSTQIRWWRSDRVHRWAWNVFSWSWTLGGRSEPPPAR